MSPTDYETIFPHLKLDYEEIIEALARLGYEFNSIPKQQQADESVGEAYATATPIQGLLKYHGMVDSNSRIAFFPSISLNNGTFQTLTYVRFDSNLKRDKFVLNGLEQTSHELFRVQYQLQQIREYVNVSNYALVISRNIDMAEKNRLVTAKGIGTSASGGAAIAKAAFNILFHDRKIANNPRMLSIFSRYMSGSAARSSIGGIALWLSHPTCETWDSYAIRLDKPIDQDFVNDLSLITIPMKSSITTSSAHDIAPFSPLFKDWCISRKSKIMDFLKAISNHDFEKIGILTEEDSKKLHEIHNTAPNGKSYWNNTTKNIIELTLNMRERGIPIYFSIDTGPSVVLLTYKKYTEEIIEVLMRDLRTSVPINSGSIKGPSTLIAKKSKLLHLLDDDIEKYSKKI